MRTELSRVQTEAQKQSFERNGYTKYEFVALGSACEICTALSYCSMDIKEKSIGFPFRFTAIYGFPVFIFTVSNKISSSCSNVLQ